jgi:cbb3-type cytochrome oxidase subunit 3
MSQRIVIGISVTMVIFLVFIAGLTWIARYHRGRKHIPLPDEERGDAIQLEEGTRAPVIGYSGSRYTMHDAAPPLYSTEATTRGYGQYMVLGEPPRAALPPSPIQRTSSAPPVIPPLELSSTPLYEPIEQSPDNEPPPPPVLSPVSAERQRRRDIFRKMPFIVPGEIYPEIGVPRFPF